MIGLFGNHSEDISVEKMKKELEPREELNFSKNGYIFSSEGFESLEGEIWIRVKFGKSEICTLRSVIFANSNILILELFTEPSHRRKGIADIVVSAFVEKVKELPDSINIYVNPVCREEDIPLEKLKEFYRKHGIIDGGACASDWAQANYIPED